MSLGTVEFILMMKSMIELTMIESIHHGRLVEIDTVNVIVIVANLVMETMETNKV